MHIKIVGKAKNISKEEVRAWIWASLCILGYHNLAPVVCNLVYRFKKQLNKNDDFGLATRSLGIVEIKSELPEQDTFTTILHETIHLCAAFPDGSAEACTTTLCSRIKPDVARLAHILLDGTYKRAAAIAHCKISYPPKDGKDFYNKGH